MQKLFTIGLMKYKLWSSLTAAMLMTAIGQIPATHAETNQTENQNSSSPQSENLEKAEPANSANKAKTALNSQTQKQKEDIAKIHSHILTGRQAATLYVRNIPVLTFLGNNLKNTQSTTPPGKRQIIYGLQNTDSATKALNTSTNNSQGENQAYQSQPNDPIRRASEIAAQINKISSSENLSTNSISVTPQKGDTYLIKINQKSLVALDDATILPDTTLSRAEDALQATNRLRRLLADAPPLSEIPGKPKQPIAVNPYQTNPNQPTQQATTFSSAPVMYRLSGWASWYGPGFDGNTSASGEIFNQNDLTAAHKELPFGTFVRVTNLDNGLTVIVRINDRGPYVGDRIIDLSAGAAQVLGMMGSGVAPVSVEVLGTQNSQALPNR